MEQPESSQQQVVSFRMIGPMAELFAAKAKARLEFKPIEKNRHVTVRTDKGPYEFDYATLDSVRASCDESLAQNGLDVFHAPCDAADGSRELHTFLTHSSGAFVECVVVLPREPMKIQAVGSLLTYWERYAYVALVGVASEHDDDGNQADGNQIQDMKARQPRRTPPAPQQSAKAPVAPLKPTEPLPTRFAQESAPEPVAPVEDDVPSPQRSIITDPTADEGIPQELAELIRAEFIRLRFNGVRATKYISEMFRKDRHELTKLEGARLLQALKDGVVP
ncbi:MAG TPA: ERF family protein [Terracidiphilus sp.]|jgi:hypothetical protein